MNKIIKLLLKLNNSKVLLLMVEILQTLTGKLLDVYLPFVKESVLNAEQIGKYIKDNSTLQDDVLVKVIGDLYGYYVTIEEVRMIKYSPYKGLGKNLLAYRLIKERFESEKINFLPFIINILIEIVVTKYLK